MFDTPAKDYEERSPDPADDGIIHPAAANRASMLSLAQLKTSGMRLVVERCGAYLGTDPADGR
jgi:hypothetical protein